MTLLPNLSHNQFFQLGKRPARPQSISQSTDIKIREVQNQFPIHVGGDDDKEEIAHPGVLFSGSARLRAILPPTVHFPETMSVPKFWDPPVYTGGIREFLGRHGQRLMTPAEAESIGSLYDGRETIFVSVASYRDPECRPTVENLYLRAKYPDRIRVAIIDQIDPEGDPKCSQPAIPCDQDPNQVLCKYHHLIDVLEVPAFLMVGPVFARHLAHRMYRGEYFVLQVDAHVRFTQNWDDDLIEQWWSAQNEMAVLSTYLTDIADSIDPQTHQSLRGRSRNVMCLLEYEGYGNTQHLILKAPYQSRATIHNGPMLHPYWSAGFSFARGHFIIQVPYDQYLPMVFQGEESSIAIRGFTYGYDYYVPERSVAFHIYAMKENISRRNRHKYWENETYFVGALDKSLLRINGILGAVKGMDDDPNIQGKYFSKDMDRYGIGFVRHKHQYYETFGIHTDTQTVEARLCNFVLDSMHERFNSFLRNNRMGIDYAKINFQFRDPRKNGFNSNNNS